MVLDAFPTVMVTSMALEGAVPEKEKVLLEEILVPMVDYVLASRLNHNILLP